MNIAESEVRYERKWDVSGWGVKRLENLLLVHPARWRPLYPERVIHSVYWDTVAFTSFFEHQAGVECRLKTRLRWYGETPSPARDAALERKIKQGSVGIKERYPVGDVTHLLDRPKTDWESLWSGSGIPAPVRAEMLTRRPVIWISYRRQYWISADGKFRLTLDRDIEAGVWSRPPFGGIGLKFDWPVLEIKYAVDADTDAPRLFQTFPFRPAKSSKYVLAAGRLLELERG